MPAPKATKGRKSPKRGKGRPMSARQLADIYEASPVVIYMAEPAETDGPMAFAPVYVGPGFEHQLGWTPCDMVGNPDFWPSHLHPDDRDRILDGIQGLLVTGQLAQEYRLRHKDGSYRWVHDVSRLEYDDSGAPARIIGYWFDLTERKRSEDAHRESEERLRAIVENLMDGLVVIDEAGVILAFNPAAQRMFGYDAGEAIGEDVGILMCGDEAKQHDAAIDRYLRTGDSQIIGIGPRGMMARRKDTTKFPVEIAISEVRLGGERTFIGAVRDMTERKRVEDALLASQASLANAQRMAHIGNWEWDIANQTIQWSAELYRIFALEPQDPGPDYQTFLAYVHPDDRKRVDQIVTKCIECSESAEFQHRIIRQDGEIRDMEIRFEMVADAAGAPALMLGVCQDITERKRAEEAMRAAKQEAELASRAKSEFLANMSHELRTPLNAVIGFSEIISSESLGPVGTPKYREYAADINDSGQHLLDLINDMLDLSKIESGAVELSENAIDVPALVASVITLVKERAERAGIDLVEDIPGDLPQLHGDNRKIKQILVNLLTNAIKFSDRGGRVTLGVWCRPDTEYVFRVADCGIGIAPEDIAKALAPFGQVGNHLHRSSEGTGLGLPLTRALIEIHGGTMDLQSEPGVGTTVTVRFPAQRIRVTEESPVFGWGGGRFRP